MADNSIVNDFMELGMREFARSHYGESIVHFSHVLENDAHNITAYLSRGAAYLKLNLLDQAWADFDRAIAIVPDHARAFHMRGLVEEKRGEYGRALSDFDRAIELDPEYGAAYYSRATLHTNMENSEEAQADAQMVAHLGNKNLESYMNENNIWQTQHMHVEDALETELER